jgi:hypothetical protein
MTLNAGQVARSLRGIPRGRTIRKTIVATVVAGFALATLTPTASLALKPGFGGVGFHPFFHGRGFAHRGSSQFPWYGGISAYDPYSFVTPQAGGDGDTVIRLIPPPEPPYSLTCKHSEETKAVPSEDGGVKQIVVTRC